MKEIAKGQDIAWEPAGEGVQRKILARGGGMMMVEAAFAKGSAGAGMHTHPHEQVCYVKNGRFAFEMNGQQTILEPGDSYYVAPNVPHGATALEDGVLLDIFTPQREDFLVKP